MSEQFDAEFWREHWQEARNDEIPPHPELSRVARALRPGSALDAGCGTGTEALWLAEHGWDVTGVDISEDALALARSRAGSAAVSWIRADLTSWDPARAFDLVVSFYAHAPIPQLDLYARLAGWVAPGGTLLLVGHSAAEHPHAHESSDSPVARHPHEATAPLGDLIALFTPSEWDVLAAVESDQPTDRGPRLHDVILEARRR